MKGHSASQQPRQGSHKGFSSWLKGGIIGALIPLFLFVGMILTGPDTSRFDSAFFLTAYAFATILTTLLSLFLPFGRIPESQPLVRYADGASFDLSSAIITAFVWFIVGAFFGWIVGKVYAKNSA